MSGRKAKLDSAAVALHKAGVKIGGRKGARVAKAISSATLGRHLEPCSEACGWCNVPCVNDTCDHD